ncbi:MAG TPA: hypothetical protein VEP90_05060 [Methylomirabilota bacterium]|nr:hypothetical protein [Methylomirabilota bacterium]
MTNSAEYMREFRRTHRETLLPWRREWYRKHAETEKLKAKEYYRNHVTEAKAYHKARQEDFQKWKAVVGCVKCGEDDGRCLDFHHINPSEKKFEIIVTKWYSMPLLSLIDEIAKCEVLCANCHRREEFENGVWK